jgi:hypothetical protein
VSETTIHLAGAQAAGEQQEPTDQLEGVARSVGSVLGVAA